jgi:hypothetical protein
MTLGRTSGAVLVSFGPKAAAGKVDTIAEAAYLSRRQLGCAFSSHGVHFTSGGDVLAQQGGGVRPFGASFNSRTVKPRSASNHRHRYGPTGCALR